MVIKCSHCNEEITTTDMKCPKFGCKTIEENFETQWHRYYFMNSSLLDIKIKKLHPDARLPHKQYEGDACYDLYAIEDTSILAGYVTKVRFGIAWEIPEGYEAVVRGRSSSFVNKHLHVFVGTVDQQYRGEIICAVVPLVNYKIKFTNIHGKKLFEKYDSAVHKITTPFEYTIKKGEAVAQVAFRRVPRFNIVEVDELSDTDRGTSGFGSTG